MTAAKRARPASSADAGAEIPAVLAERDALARRLEGAHPADAAAIATAAQTRRDTADATRTAFTLRLDPDRRLRLRIAAALTGRSAQLLVTDAIDRLLADLPEVEAMVSRIPDIPVAPRRG